MLACSCPNEQTPGSSKIHPHNLPISLDKPSRTADSQGRVDCPKCRKTSAFLGEDITHTPLLPGCFPPAYNLPPGPTGNHRPRLAQDRGSSWATPLILPPPPQGVGLMYKEGTCTNIAHLTYVCNLLHTPSGTNILYTHGKPGIEYTTTNLLHSCNINMKSYRLYL